MMLFSVLFFGQRNYVSYNEDNGLSSSRIYRMKQDLEGNMWFATNRGLTKFDGAKFRTFTYKDGLPNQDVWDLYVDGKNRIWFFSKSKFQGYIFKDKIYVFPNTLHLNISPSTFFINKDRVFLYQSWNRVFEFKDSIFVHKKMPLWEELTNEKKRFYANPFTNHIVLLDLNEIHFLTKDFHKEVSYTFPGNMNNQRTKGGAITSDVLYHFMDRGMKFIDFKNKKIKYFSAESLFKTKQFPQTAKFDLENGKIRLSGAGHQLIFDSNFNVIQRRSFLDVFSNNLQLYEDRDGNFWFNNGTSLDFVSRENMRAKRFLNGEKITRLNTINNALYAGGEKGILYRYDQNKNDFVAELSFGTYVNAINPSQNVLVGEGDIFEYKAGKWNKLEYPKYPYSKSSSHFKNFVHYRDKQIVLAGSSVYVFDSKNTKNYKEINASNLFRVIEFNNTLYFGGTNGLYAYHRDQIVPVFSEKFNFPITSLEIIGNLLYIGTNGRGVFTFDGKYLYHISATDGLHITRVRPDEKKSSKFWFSSNKGVKRMKIEGSKSVASTITDNFTKDDGLSSNNINDFFVKNDTLFAASDFGISQLFLRDKMFYRKVPVVFNVPNKLRISPEQRKNLKITVLPKSFVRSNSVKLYYRFLPDQKTWVPLKSKEIVFNSLSAGNHILEVKSVTTHLVESVSKLKIEVDYLWWEKSWIQWLMGLLGLVLIGLVYLFFYRRLKKQLKVKMENKSKIASLELQALRSQMNPHFVHNSLNAIQYYIQRNDVELSENYLTRFSRLIRMFFDYSERQTISLKEELELLENYLLIEKMRFEDKFSYQIICDENLQDINPQIPSMILQPIVENAINHGIFHRKKDGLIKISFEKQNNNTIEIIIEDNGIGIKKSVESYSKKQKKQSSEILKSRIKLLNESYIPITYEIYDKADLGKGEEGTWVRILLNNNEQKS